MNCARLIDADPDLSASDAALLCYGAAPRVDSAEGHPDSLVLGPRALASTVPLGLVGPPIVVTIGSRFPLELAEAAMTEYGVEALAVTEPSGRFIGAVTLARMAPYEAGEPSITKVDPTVPLMLDSHRLTEAILGMAQGRSRLVAVMRADRTIVGMVSDLSALRWFAH